MTALCELLVTLTGARGVGKTRLAVQATVLPIRSCGSGGWWGRGDPSGLGRRTMTRRSSRSSLTTTCRWPRLRLPEWQAALDALKALLQMGVEAAIGYGSVTLGVVPGLVLTAWPPPGERGVVARSASHEPVSVHRRRASDAMGRGAHRD
jgi:hypothetical protein